MARTSEKVCRECSGSGIITEPFYPDANHIRFVEKVCNICSGMGVLFEER